MHNKERFAVANLKMNLSNQVDLRHWLTSFQKAKKDLKLEKTAIVLCPQDIFLGMFSEANKEDFVALGLQNCFWEGKGAFTGETSPEAAHWMGAKYVILGHSERRRFLGETDEMVALKVRMALKARLRPIVCIGENAKQKRNDEIIDVVLSQMSACLSQVSRGLIAEVILCYEPVWAISANQPDHMPSTNEVMGARLLMKKFLTQTYGGPLAEKVKIIYGGSVDGSNVDEVVVSAGMDGALIGGASLRPYELAKIAQQIESASNPVQFRTIDKR